VTSRVVNAPSWGMGRARSARRVHKIVGTLEAAQLGFWSLLPDDVG
jgi:hypothetical protein